MCMCFADGACFDLTDTGPWKPAYIIVQGIGVGANDNHRGIPGRWPGLELAYPLIGSIPPGYLKGTD
jgi:hypothetical protein